MAALPFTCPKCHVVENEIETLVVPFNVRDDDPAAGRRCPACYERYRVWRDAEIGLRRMTRLWAKAVVAATLSACVLFQAVPLQQRWEVFRKLRVEAYRAQCGNAERR